MKYNIDDLKKSFKDHEAVIRVLEGDFQVFNYEKYYESGEIQGAGRCTIIIDNLDNVTRTSYVHVTGDYGTHTFEFTQKVFATSFGQFDVDYLKEKYQGCKNNWDKDLAFKQLTDIADIIMEDEYKESELEQMFPYEDLSNQQRDRLYGTVKINKKDSLIDHWSECELSKSALYEYCESKEDFDAFLKGDGSKLQELSEYAIDSDIGADFPARFYVVLAMLKSFSESLIPLAEKKPDVYLACLKAKIVRIYHMSDFTPIEGDDKFHLIVDNYGDRYLKHIKLISNNEVLDLKKYVHDIAFSGNTVEIFLKRVLPENVYLRVNLE